MTRLQRYFLLLSAILVCTTGLLAQQWRPVGGSRQDNISGMALVEQIGDRSVFFVVHDNKKDDQRRLSFITLVGDAPPNITSLKWKAVEMPVDLEAASRVPGFSDQYLLLSSSGRGYHVRLDRILNEVTAIKAFDLPKKPKDADFEGFTLQSVNGKLIAVWGDRGTFSEPGILFYAVFDLASCGFSGTGSTQIKVPYPTRDTRHISDIKVDPSGGVFIAAASDPGNDGPFSSALYFAGVIKADDQGVSFLANVALTQIYRFPYRKLEAFEFVPGPSGGIAFGTDDENLGSAIATTY